ncbi:MAG: hypothetical protein AAGG38_03400 [Planctomycetota bacterium]
MDVGRVTGTAASLGLFLTLMGIGGCAPGTPFKDSDRVRTPYERYQVLRGEKRPKTVTDSFGKEQPALRARLAPLDP